MYKYLHTEIIAKIKFAQLYINSIILSEILISALIKYVISYSYGEIHKHEYNINIHHPEEYRYYKPITNIEPTASARGSRVRV